MKLKVQIIILISLVVKCVCELQFANVKFANYFDPFDECEKNSFAEIDRFYKIV